MDIKTQCIAGIEHKPEYHKTEEGNSYYVCWQCGEVTWVAEDSGHGG